MTDIPLEVALSDLRQDIRDTEARLDARLTKQDDRLDSIYTLLITVGCMVLAAVIGLVGFLIASR